MFITRKQLPRRTFLKGIGTAIALPMLDAMTPALAAAPKAPVRLAFLYVPNGVVNIDWWRPKGEGRNFEFSRLMKPLEPMREDILVLSGLDDHNGNALGDGPGDHGRAGASYLSGVHCKKTAGADIQAGISADQVAAQIIGSQTRFASLELGCEDSRTVGNCDSGYSCAYTNSISWRTPTTPNPPEINPRMAFERLFGTADLSLSAEVRARRAAYRKSILDMVSEDTKKLTGKLGASDKRKLDEYLYAVREIEQRIEKAETENRDITPPFEKPVGIPASFNEYVRLMCDIQMTAFQTDLTRISTLIFAREGSMRVYPEIGINDPHHPLTHHRNIAEWIEKVAQINVYHVRLFTEYLQRLKTVKEGDGNLLDNSMIVYGAGISDGNRHNHEDLPTILAGRGGGAFKPGRHIFFKPGKPMTNLYLTLLDQMGAHPEKIGDSTGRLDQLAL
ncbi:MAG: DUF1552 domain-containing protein [Acidobacteriota bacterium]|nr:DUF1552 domain-containing protein [Acidobacteriota bacterium]